MKYLITDTGIIRISERSGVIQNASQSDGVELSDSESFTDIFILYPLKAEKFTKQLYIRGYGKISQPIGLNVVDFIEIGDGGNSSGDTTDTTTNNIDEYLDGVLSGGDDNYNDPDTSGYIDDIFNGGDDNSTDNDFEGYLDDIFNG